MKKVILVAVIGAIMAGCGLRPVDELRIVGPSETAFLVSLEGDTLKNQAALRSVDFYEKSKISAKRVLIPHKIIDTCPSCSGNDHQKDVATAQLFTVNRAPISREWTASAKGTSPKNQAFGVESNESIDFDIGATITAHIAEEGAAKFLYFYSGKQLEEIIDTNVRSFMSSQISTQMGSQTVDWDRTHKNEVFATALKNAREFFSAQGITIDNLGFTEGMTFRDPAIQIAINKKFEADQQVGINAKIVEAAEMLAKAKDAVAATQALENRKREIEITAMAVAKWDGKSMPQVMGSDGKMIFGINTLGIK